MTPADLLAAPLAHRWESTADAPAEYLVTNGLGGYAFGTVAGPPLRRFHGLLVAALPAPLGRTMLLHGLDDAVRLNDGPLMTIGAIQGGPSAVDRHFSLVAGLPVWRFEMPDGVVLERSLVMPHGANTVHIRYRSIGRAAAVHLELRPWLDIRRHQDPLSDRQTRTYHCAALADSRLDVSVEGGPTITLAPHGTAVTFRDDERAAEDIAYDVERARGYDHRGSAYSPGAWDLTLGPDRDGWLTATSDPWADVAALGPAEAWTAELARRERLIAASHPALRRPHTFLLPLAADQFVIRPIARTADTVRARAAGAEPRSIIAGYPWFTDWGRDTMIGLEGLTLATGRFDEARDILRMFASHVRDGLIPNLFPEGDDAGLYHTADATLWFFHALDRYDTVTGDGALVDELLPTLQDIVRCHLEGTRFGIGVAADGLLTQGSAELPLTWMDARMGDWVVTPRRGKPVEINALWHNALRLLAEWTIRAGDRAAGGAFAGDADRCRGRFTERFWNPDRRCLFDVVDGDGGDDPAVRPNQVLAVAVRHSPLDPRHWADVVDTVAEQLLTPVGLRTLAPAEPGYQRQYAGDLRARDGAYHQGTTWPWLLGPFVEAWLRVHPERPAQRLLAPLLDHLTGAGCLGSVSEIFDSEAPYTARGCVAQAWSVAELARLVVRLDGGDRAADPDGISPA